MIGYLCYTSIAMSYLRRVFAFCLIVVLLGQGCTKGPTAEAVKLSEKKDIEIWGVVDDEYAYRDILESFHATYPYATITFKRFRLEEYEDKLLNALAEDKGPDLFMIHNTWVGKYASKILPQPPKIKVAEQIVTGTLKKEVTLEVRESRTESPTNVRKDFVDAVAADAIRSVDVSTDPTKKDMQERVMALPMSVDTLALYYNKDLLNAAGIATPPETWSQFQEQVKKLAVVGPSGNIIRAGAGFGTGKNVERSSDIISLLMMQNRTVMADSNGYPMFARIPQALSQELKEPPSFEALRFYTDFANPGKDVYTWNADQPNSLDAFIMGTAGFFIGYSYELPVIRARAPKLNLGITHIPQIDQTQEVNFANYWMWTVSKKTESPDLSWRLANYLTDEEHAKIYLDAAKRPAARRALIDAQLEDADIGVFASQLLTATSWYRGIDPEAAEGAMIELIDTIVSGTLDIQKAVRVAVEKIAQTVK